MEIKVYSQLPVYSVEIRTQVFVKEQGFDKEFELDKNEGRATHLVGFLDGKMAATARFYFSDEHNAYLIGRIAVLKEHRKKGFGAEIVRACEQCIADKGGKRAIIHAQARAKGFYEAIGYSSFGDTDFEEGVEHIWMTKNL